VLIDITLRPTPPQRWVAAVLLLVSMSLGQADEVGKGPLRTDPVRPRSLGGEVSSLRSLEPVWALAPAQPKLSHINLLVVDDNPDSGHLLKTFLEYCGASVRIARSATRALHALRSFSPHVILSDIAMHGHDGVWLIDQLRMSPHEPRAKIPVVAITAYGAEFSAETALARGFDAYLEKPVELSILTDLIRRLAGPKAA
jgi:CheY-like chemotaxis protein